MKLYNLAGNTLMKLPLCHSITLIKLYSSIEKTLMKLYNNRKIPCFYQAR